MERVSRQLVGWRWKIEVPGAEERFPTFLARRHPTKRQAEKIAAQIPGARVVDRWLEAD